MRLFGYYALHSFFNQLRKLFKTWVLIFLVACMVIGGAIGYGASRISELSESSAEQQTQVQENAQETEPESEVLPFEEIQNPLERSGLDPLQIIELIAGAVIFAVFLIEVLGADKNGSKIFLPADVNLLFASPMKPQSVLMFRLMTQLGMAIISSIYLLFQLPNLVLNLGVSIWAGLAVIATWGLTIIIGKLLQLLLYMLTSNHPGWKPWLRRAVYLLVALVAAVFIFSWRRSGDGLLAAAVRTFCSPWTRWIPFWGWLKGFCVYAMEGSWLWLLCLALLLVCGGALVYGIWHIKADFYEDAMAKSEETAALLEQAQSEKSTGLVVRRKKDRSEKLRRDGMGHGSGANVFFFKSLYNRFRFAHLGFFTKTMETYLVAAVGLSLFLRLVLDSRNLIPVALALAAIAFFRTLGNPLEQDTKLDYFNLIPESTWAKLFWSLMGGTVNCLLDVLPAMLAAVLLLGANPLVGLAWVFFIISVDFYATNVGAFIGFSVPVSAGKTVKQVVQVMFIYFGLLPDAAIMAIGLVTGHPALGALGAAAVNLVLGFLFFALSPLFLDPKGGTQNMDFSERPALDLGAAKRHFSKLGMGAFMILLITIVVQIIVQVVLQFVNPDLMENEIAFWILNFAPLYLVAVPIGVLMIRRVPKNPVGDRHMSVGQWITTAIICIFMMYAGNLVGMLVLNLFNGLFGGSATNPLESLLDGSSLGMQILVTVILAPIVEELIFRRLMIDRMNVYGQRLAVVTSALMFGLFHGNLSQFFYAFALGLVFGYVYLRTGKLRYTIALHMFVNFMGGVIGPLMLKYVDVEALENFQLDPAAADLNALMESAPKGMGIYAAYIVALIGLAIAGLVLLCVNARKVHFESAPLELPKGSRFKTVWLNAGMILLVLACVAEIVLTFVM